MIPLPTRKPRPYTSSFMTARSVCALILREMSTTYGRSPGGYLWAILEPAVGIAVLVVIFSAGFRSPPLGQSFALFYAGGMLPFIMFNEVSNRLSQTILFSKSLLEYPRVTYFDALLARLTLNVMTQLMVHLIVMAFILVVVDPHTTFDFSKIALAYFMIICLTAGVGILNSFLVLYTPLWQTIWAITTRPLMILSCIFYNFEAIPQPYRDFLWYNPLVHVVGLMRDGTYPFYNPTYISPTYVLGLAGILATAGLLLLNRFHRDIMYK